MILMGGCRWSALRPILEKFGQFPEFSYDFNDIDINDIDIDSHLDSSWRYCQFPELCYDFHGILLLIRCRGTFLQVCSVNEQFENSEDKHQRKSGEMTESDGPKVTHFL